MPLTRFKLVKTQGLKGLSYKGDYIPFDKIDDKLAEELIGKTHVLERLPETEAAPQLALADSSEPATGAEPVAGAEEPAAQEPAAAETEAPAAGRKPRR